MAAPLKKRWLQKVDISAFQEKPTLSFSPRPLCRLSAFVLRDRFEPLLLSEYEAILGNARRLLQGRNTYLRPKRTSTVDDEVREQQQILVEEESKNQPILGEKEPLSALTTDFPSDSLIIQEKIKLLGEKYASFRRIRRDGNCLYRSFIFSYLEHIVQFHDEDEVYRVFEHLEQLKLDYVSLGESEETYEHHLDDFQSAVISILEAKNTCTSFMEIVQKNLTEIDSHCILVFLRLVTSIDIRKREEFFRPFFYDEMKHVPIKQFCEREVLTMGVEADNLHVIALSNAFCVPIRVENLDSFLSAGAVKLNPYDVFPNQHPKHAPVSDPLTSGVDQTDSATSSAPKLSGISSVSLGRVPFVTLLYRPGHYDILYPRNLFTH
ncbi:OVARIAN TUMOR DOMAIN-containing deubiquitinating enzyme 1-like [Typha latifolia]|uniref:OVARIAN TUMOR DOMAIN-containing deubiquitinating enzyme 1-like n=1 Tax=Typha latifolia TaxID=4733 RepID=UPI003C2AF1AC